MPQSQRPLFLARASYKMRRLRDGARMLPVFGLVLLILPMLWPARAAFEWLYIFGIWAALVGVAAAISGPLAEMDDPPSGAPPGGED